MSTEASGSKTKPGAAWLKAVNVIAYCLAGFVLLAYALGNHFKSGQ
jgi:hypothetical protein